MIGGLGGNASERDWPEDFPHENGNYWNTCIRCKKAFTGHKRRVICKRCANKRSFRDRFTVIFTVKWAHVAFVLLCIVMVLVALLAILYIRSLSKQSKESTSTVIGEAVAYPNDMDRPPEPYMEPPTPFEGHTLGFSPMIELQTTLTYKGTDSEWRVWFKDYTNMAHTNGMVIIHRMKKTSLDNWLILEWEIDYGISPFAVTTASFARVAWSGIFSGALTVRDPSKRTKKIDVYSSKDISDTWRDREFISAYRTAEAIIAAYHYYDRTKYFETDDMISNNYDDTIIPAKEVIKAAKRMTGRKHGHPRWCW